MSLRHSLSVSNTSPGGVTRIIPQKCPPPSPFIAVASIQATSKGGFWINYFCPHSLVFQQRGNSPPSFVPLVMPKDTFSQLHAQLQTSSGRNVETDNSPQRFLALIYPPWKSPGSSNLLSLLHFASPHINPGNVKGNHNKSSWLISQPQVPEIEDFQFCSLGLFAFAVVPPARNNYTKLWHNPYWNPNLFIPFQPIGTHPWCFPAPCFCEWDCIHVKICLDHPLWFIHLEAIRRLLLTISHLIFISIVLSP